MNKLYNTYPYNFGAAHCDVDEKDALVCIIPFPYNSTNSTTTAAQRGPEAILEASRDLELFDSELGVETYKIGIQTMDEVEPNVNSAFENSQVIEAVVSDVLHMNKMPIGLGGDHSITIGIVRAIHKKYSDVGFLMLDAHPDLFDKYEGTKYGHANSARRVYDLGIPLSLVGVRSASLEETNFINSAEITVISAQEILKSPEAIYQALTFLPDHIYLSIDLDVMDPSEMPAVGNPEPGGLRWYDMMDVIKKIVDRKKVVGFDITEICPIPGNPTPDFIAAKLIYRTIGLIFKDKL